MLDSTFIEENYRLYNITLRPIGAEDQWYIMQKRFKFIPLERRKWSCAGASRNNKRLTATCSPFHFSFSFAFHIHIHTRIYAISVLILQQTIQRICSTTFNWIAVFRSRRSRSGAIFWNCVFFRHLQVSVTKEDGFFYSSIYLLTPYLHY